MRFLAFGLAVGFSGMAYAQLTESPVAADAVVHLKVTRPAKQQALPPTLFGSFLEPIGHSTYGGLWADLVENPSLEEGMWSERNAATILHDRPELGRASELGLPLPWAPLDASEGNRYAPERGDAANSEQSLLVMALPNKEVGIAERIYLPVQRELSYGGSLWLKRVQGTEPVRVSLRMHGRASQMLAEAPVNATAAEWTKYPFSFTLKPGQVAPLEAVDLVVAVDGETRVLVDNIHLNPADAVDGMDPDVLALARDLHTPVVRFGGNFTSAYDWKDGLGPEDKRVSKINLAWGIPEYNTFGTDEFLDFCKRIHAEPQIALNLGTGTPEEAAAWVKYVDSKLGRQGLLWELGNELWGDWQVGYPAQSQVAARTLAASKAVRAVDPTARLIGTGADEDTFHDWNAQQLTNPPDTVSYLSTHFVVGDQVELPHSTDDFRTMAALAMPWGLAARMEAEKKQMADAGHGSWNVAFTEWLMAGRNGGPRFTNMGGALFAGGFLNMVMRESEIVPISDMTGILEFGGIWKKREQVYGAPSYWVLRTYASTEPKMLLTVTSDGPSYSIAKGVNRLPEIPGVPYLDCTAADTANGTALFCLNRNLTRPLKAEIDLGASGQAKITTLQADSLDAENTEEEPDRVKPTTETRTVSGTMAYTFPNASVTVIELSRR